MFYSLAVITFGTAVPAGQFVPGIMIGSTYGRLVGMFVVNFYKKPNIEEGTWVLFCSCFCCLALDNVPGPTILLFDYMFTCGSSIWLEISKSLFLACVNHFNRSGRFIVLFNLLSNHLILCWSFSSSVWFSKIGFPSGWRTKVLDGFLDCTCIDVLFGWSVFTAAVVDYSLLESSWVYLFLVF